MRKINLMHVVHNLLIGGAQQLVKVMALNVDRGRYNPMVCSLIDYPGKGDVEPLTDELRREGIPVYTLYMNKIDDPEKDKFIALLKDRQVDVAHCHIFHTDLWGSVLAKEAGVKAIFYTKHDTYKNKSKETRKKYAGMYNKSVDRALAISHTTVRHLWSYEYIYPWKIRLVHNPVETAVFDPAKVQGDLRAEYGIPEGAPVVGGVARFVARKGLDAFIRTCAKVSEAAPDAWFVLAGSGEKEPELRQLVGSLGVRNFVFAGARRDMAQVYKTLDVFLFTPYSGEAFPMVMLEAMSMEKAVVAANVCSNPELIKDGVTGFLPTPRRWAAAVGGLDADEMAGAVIRLIKDATLRARFGMAARESVRERFDIVPIMRKLESYYEKVLRKKGVWP